MLLEVAQKQLLKMFVFYVACFLSSTEFVQAEDTTAFEETLEQLSIYNTFDARPFKASLWMLETCSDENPMGLSFFSNKHTKLYLRRNDPENDTYKFADEKFNWTVDITKKIVTKLFQFAHDCLTYHSCDEKALGDDIWSTLDEHTTWSTTHSTSKILSSKSSALQFLPPSSPTLQFVDHVNSLAKFIRETFIEALWEAPAADHEVQENYYYEARVNQILQSSNHFLLTVAYMNCDLQYRNNAFAAFDLERFISESESNRNLYFRFDHMQCCRRYHVLEKLIKDTMQESGMSNDLHYDKFSLVEIGVNNAVTSHYLMKKIENLHVIGVDPLFTDTEGDIEPLARRVFEEEFAERSEFAKTTSVGYVETVPDSSLDMVFVDGDHSKEAVIEDIVLWYPKLKPNGIMAGHDLFNPEFEGVLPAIEHVFAKETKHVVISFSFDFTWWWKKTSDLASLRVTKEEL